MHPRMAPVPCRNRCLGSHRRFDRRPITLLEFANGGQPSRPLCSRTLQQFHYDGSPPKGHASCHLYAPRLGNAFRRLASSADASSVFVPHFDRPEECAAYRLQRRPRHVVLPLLLRLRRLVGRRRQRDRPGFPQLPLAGLVGHCVPHLMNENRTPTIRPSIAESLIIFSAASAITARGTSLRSRE